MSKTAKIDRRLSEIKRGIAGQPKGELSKKYGEGIVDPDVHYALAIKQIFSYFNQITPGSTIDGNGVVTSNGVAEDITGLFFDRTAQNDDVTYRANVVLAKAAANPKLIGGGSEKQSVLLKAMLKELFSGITDADQKRSLEEKIDSVIPSNEPASDGELIEIKALMDSAPNDVVRLKMMRIMHYVANSNPNNYQDTLTALAEEIGVILPATSDALPGLNDDSLARVTKALLEYDGDESNAISGAINAITKQDGINAEHIEGNVNRDRTICRAIILSMGRDGNFPSHKLQFISRLVEAANAIGNSNDVDLDLEGALRFVLVNHNELHLNSPYNMKSFVSQVRSLVDQDLPAKELELEFLKLGLKTIIKNNHGAHEKIDGITTDDIADSSDRSIFGSIANGNNGCSADSMLCIANIFDNVGVNGTAPSDAVGSLGLTQYANLSNLNYCLLHSESLPCAQVVMGMIPGITPNCNQAIDNMTGIDFAKKFGGIFTDSHPPSARLIGQIEAVENAAGQDNIDIALTSIDQATAFAGLPKLKGGLQSILSPSRPEIKLAAKKDALNRLLVRRGDISDAQTSKIIGCIDQITDGESYSEFLERLGNIEATSDISKKGKSFNEEVIDVLVPPELQKELSNEARIESVRKAALDYSLDRSDANARLLSDSVTEGMGASPSVKLSLEEENLNSLFSISKSKPGNFFIKKTGGDVVLESENEANLKKYTLTFENELDAANFHDKLHWHRDRNRMQMEGFTPVVVEDKIYTPPDASPSPTYDPSLNPCKVVLYFNQGVGNPIDILCNDLITSYEAKEEQKELIASSKDKVGKMVVGGITSGLGLFPIIPLVFAGLGKTLKVYQEATGYGAAAAETCLRIAKLGFENSLFGRGMVSGLTRDLASVERLEQSNTNKPILKWYDYPIAGLRRSIKAPFAIGFGVAGAVCNLVSTIPHAVGDFFFKLDEKCTKQAEKGGLNRVLHVPAVICKIIGAPFGALGVVTKGLGGILSNSATSYSKSTESSGMMAWWGRVVGGSDRIANNAREAWVSQKTFEDIDMDRNKCSDLQLEKVRTSARDIFKKIVGPEYCRSGIPDDERRYCAVANVTLSGEQFVVLFCPRDGSIAVVRPETSGNFRMKNNDWGDDLNKTMDRAVLVDLMGRLADSSNKGSNKLTSDDRNSSIERVTYHSPNENLLSLEGLQQLQENSKSSEFHQRFELGGRKYSAHHSEATGLILSEIIGTTLKGETSEERLDEAQRLDVLGRVQRDLSRRPNSRCRLTSLKALVEKAAEKQQ